MWIIFVILAFLMTGCMTPEIREAHRQADELDKKQCEEYAAEKAGPAPKEATDLERDRWRANRVLWFEKCMHDKNDHMDHTTIWFKTRKFRKE